MFDKQHHTLSSSPKLTFLYEEPLKIVWAEGCG
jgi:hypothetical protein